MNDLGQVVGAYNDSAGNQHGFLLSGRNFSTIDFPGTFFTEAVRVNEVRQIVGNYILAGPHGFLATPSVTQN